MRQGGRYTGDFEAASVGELLNLSRSQGHCSIRLRGGVDFSTGDWAHDIRVSGSRECRPVREICVYLYLQPSSGGSVRETAGPSHNRAEVVADGGVPGLRP
jgi:hypothetical protein